MPRSLRTLLTPEPPWDPQDGLRAALDLHEEGKTLEAQRLRRSGLSEAEIAHTLSRWLGATPPPGAGLEGFRWVRVTP